MIVHHTSGLLSSMFGHEATEVGDEDEHPVGYRVSPW